MIPNDQPLRKETISRMLDSIEISIKSDESTYTTWEIEFIDSIADQFRTKNDLSTKQCEILERIYDK